MKYIDMGEDFRKELKRQGLIQYKMGELRVKNEKMDFFYFISFFFFFLCTVNYNNF